MKKVLDKILRVFIKADLTPRGEWVALGIAFTPYPLLTLSLFLPVPLAKMMWVTGGVIAWSAFLWGGYMKAKTAVRIRGMELKVNCDDPITPAINPENEGGDGNVVSRQDREGSGE